MVISTKKKKIYKQKTIVSINDKKGVVFCLYSYLVSFLNQLWQQTIKRRAHGTMP